MRRKSLLLVFVLFALCGFIPARAQEPPQTKMVPITDTVFNIQGVAPEGWQNAGRGLRYRKQSASDPTLLAQQAAPSKSAVVLNAIFPQFGLKEAPKSTGTRKTPAFDWSLYEFTNTIQNTDFAFALGLAEKDGRTWIVLLQTTPADIKALTASVFYPAVDALAPLAATRQAVGYREDEVTFKNGDVTLAGTLTFPSSAGPYPAVVLVTGSGAQDRDEDIGIGIKPFRLIADYLTQHGIAVLRYDDRGTVKSTGDFAAATTWDFAKDAAAAFDYLLTRKEIDGRQIGILGHSEGGMVASILVGQGKPFAFVVSMAGPAAPITDLMLKQNENILRAQKTTEPIIKATLDFLRQAYPLVVKKDFAGLDALTATNAIILYNLLTDADRKQAGDLETFTQSIVENSKTFQSDWWVNFLGYDPRADWSKATMPVLGVYGGLDVQVDAKQNATALEDTLKSSGNKDYKVVTLPDANHLMQSAKTGNVEEYATLKPEFTPDFLPIVGEWILKHVTLAK